ncbi:MAG: squalene/phytoene synthase family protein [Anaerolineae bacterium]|nr:squalene/phytoene synthase family protein [Anaerolineae bacterium]
MTDFLSKSEKEYLSDYMNKVSRSFTLVAPQVESPLNHYLSTSYLICRVVDNIEDCTVPYQAKKSRFSDFSYLLEHPENAEDILSKWERLDWDGLLRDEVKMMTTGDGLILWQIYAKIPPSYRASIRKWAGEMAYGMNLVTDLDDDSFFVTSNQIRLPKTAVDYDRYCFYVAGTVGRMITELAITYYGIDGDDAAYLLKYSEACGRALQKTNIVKDFAKDLARGDSFLPDEWLKEVNYTPFALKDVPQWWIKKVLLNVLMELDSSVNYVLCLPKTAVGYRKAGLLMMLPAYQTLLLAAKRCETLFTPEHAVKISRTTMGKCVIQAQMMATNDDNIRAYCQEISQEIKTILNISTTVPSIDFATVSSKTL